MLMTTLRELSTKKKFLCAGLMSGTSMDGVDAALVRVPADRDDPSVELVAFESEPYPRELRSSLMEIAFGDQCTAEDLATLQTGVAVSFSNAFFAVCRAANVDPKSVDFIGSHGQTVAHVPPAPDRRAAIAGTLQLGPPGMIAALSGVTTVGDFRSADMALGGQGAPLVPFADFLLRRSKTENRVVLNIGGIANVTYLPKNCGLSEVIAFDTGPGNMILDELFRVLYPTVGPYDRSGAKAASGFASQSLVEVFLGFEYFGRKPPKSAGHREFGARFAWEFLARAQAAGLKNPDILASATLLTTRSIGEAVRAFIAPVGAVDTVFVSGGGSKNETMLSQLTPELAPARVVPIDELGIPADAKEAVDFAVLARETILSRHNVIHKATGAAKPLVLGVIALGSDV
jgi:anhydro-N-acetylmuramic acid kinase